jgi:hypothetical protein
MGKKMKVHTVNPERTSCAESSSFLIFCVTKLFSLIADRSRKWGDISSRTSLGIFDNRLVFWFIITHVLHTYISKSQNNKQKNEQIAHFCSHCDTYIWRIYHALCMAQYNSQENREISILSLHWQTKDNSELQKR